MNNAMIEVAQGWCPWCGDHMGWGGWTMMIGWWLILILMIVGLVWALGRGRAWRSNDPPRRDPAEEALREQYARGEIDEETYRQRLDELRRR